ncbi:hypothetical protein INT47_001713, partial [Mucor saturninus]
LDTIEMELLNTTQQFLIQENKVPDLSWKNVAIAAGFLVVNGIISMGLGLKLEKSLLTSSIRCIVQLTIMGQILDSVFRAKNPILVMLMTCILGTRFAMNESNFLLPELFIPTIGLLLGITAGGMAVAISTCLTKVGEQSDQIETYLSFGASRWEAGKAIAIEAIRIAMLPTINQMSVIGMITIPGAMSGQILGGGSILNAVRYQQIVTFMVSATTSLGVLSVVYYCVHHLIDGKHRLRPERVRQYKANAFRDIKFLFVGVWQELFKRDEQPNEYTPLLS